MKLYLIYITTKDKVEAEMIASELLYEKLVACTNIIANTRAMYYFEGKMQNEKEVLLMAKTKESLVDETIEKISSLHSYKCPCIMSFPVEKCNQKFIDFVINNTK